MVAIGLSPRRFGAHGTPGCGYVGGFLRAPQGQVNPAGFESRPRRPSLSGSQWSLPMSDHTTAQSAFRSLTGDRPQDAAEAPNFLRHVAALGLTKSADGLADAKLVLSWLMATLGAPGVLVGLLVPVREAGSLLPQMLAVPRVRRLKRRKWVWAGASAVQGGALLAMAAAGATLSGLVAGLAILAALLVLALARSLASVSYKDVLGRTVGKGRRGTATGLAGSLASGAVLVFALLLIAGWIDRFALVIGALVLAGAAFLAAAAIFARMQEEPDTPDDTDTSLRAIAGMFRHLRTDRQLARFIVARGLLTATALAPPYLVLLATGAAEETLDSLGAMLLASALAALVSGYIWGRLADRSSRLVLVFTGIAGAVGMLLAVALGAAGLEWALPGALFALMLAHQGVRVGRSTHLVDMAPKDARPAYTALSNTIIGVALLGTGIFGALASLAGAGVTLAVFAAMALAGAWVAWGLDETGGKA
jgi:predicted MFS family arabinose efflux permease